MGGHETVHAKLVLFTLGVWGFLPLTGAGMVAREMTVTLPDTYVAGSNLPVQVTSPEGLVLSVTPPEGAGPGMSFDVEYNVDVPEPATEQVPPIHTEQSDGQQNNEIPPAAEEDAKVEEEEIQPVPDSDTELTAETDLKQDMDAESKTVEEDKVEVESEQESADTVVESEVDTPSPDTESQKEPVDKQAGRSAASEARRERLREKQEKAALRKKQKEEEMIAKDGPDWEEKQALKRAEYWEREEKNFRQFWTLEEGMKEMQATGKPCIVVILSEGDTRTRDWRGRFSKKKFDAYVDSHIVVELVDTSEEYTANLEKFNPTGAHDYSPRAFLLNHNGDVIYDAQAGSRKTPYFYKFPQVLQSVMGRHIKQYIDGVDPIQEL